MVRCCRRTRRSNPSRLGSLRRESATTRVEEAPKGTHTTTLVTKVHTIVLHRRGTRCRMTSTPAHRRGRSIRSSRFVGTKGEAEADPEDGAHLFLPTDNPAVNRMDVRMEDGVPKLLVATTLEAGDHRHLATMLEAGDPLRPTTAVRAGAPLDPAVLVKVGVPLSQEVAGDNPKW